jgi:hypothetical protein
VRKLVVISTDQYVRNLVDAGAFERIEDDETYYVASERVTDLKTLEGKRGWLGTVTEPTGRRRAYSTLRRLLLVSYRSRGPTLARKTELLPPLQRLRLKALSLPGVRQLVIRMLLRRSGRNPELHALIERIRPELLIAPSGGIDDLVMDTIRSGRELGVTTLVLVHNWDNLSSKGAFAVRPDRLGVWGEQSVEHAVRIHGFPRERVHILGVPSFDHYFHLPRGATQSPFPFRYALFAGCYAPFDERAALERIDAAIEAGGLDLKVVYRPHPHRRPRRTPDRVVESEFRHVVLDPQVRDLYEASFAEYDRGAKRAKPLFPPLDYYPALLENAELVVCPLSTMIVEAAAFERPVIVIAYDDGVHEDSPALVVGYDHFEGIDRIDGFEVCGQADELGERFARLAKGPAPPHEPLREQIRWWLHHDERTYAERLAALVAEIGGERSIESERPAYPAAR